MKFLGDMGISPRTIEYLRSLGHEAKRLLDENLDRLSDAEILDKARTEQSIVLTNDLDFGDLLAASHTRLPSVIILRLENMKPDNVNYYLRLVLELNANALEKGCIISVSSSRIRVRHLPI